MNRLFKNLDSQRIRTYILYGLPFLLIIFGWYRTVEQATSLEANTIQTYQQAQLEVVRGAARAATVYIETRLDGAIDDGVPYSNLVNRTEQTVLREFVNPISINDDSNVGDAWIYSPEYVIFDQSADFPDEYVGLSMAEIFEIQAEEKGARHYADMTEDVTAGREGVGWYVWDPEKAGDAAPWWEFITRDTGREIAAWTPVEVFPNTPSQRTWVIGMSAMLPDLMRINDAYNQINQSIMTMIIATLVASLLLLLLRRAETQVKTLTKQVQALRIEIDEGKKAQQVSAIVESDDFQSLMNRAKAMKKRRAEASRPSEPQ